MLQTTYNLNVTKLANANIAVHNKYHNEKKKKEKLTPQDLVAIGKQAFMYHWYDASIAFLLEAYSILSKNQVALRDQFQVSKTILDRVVAYHNRNLLKNRSPIGKKWKSF